MSASHWLTYKAFEWMEHGIRSILCKKASNLKSLSWVGTSRKMIITRGQLNWRIESLKEVIKSYVYLNVYEKANEINNEEVQSAIKALKAKHEAGILREKTVPLQRCFNHLCKSAFKSNESSLPCFGYF